MSAVDGQVWELGVMGRGLLVAHRVAHRVEHRKGDDHGKSTCIQHSGNNGGGDMETGVPLL